MRLFAVFSFRYDSTLVPDLLANLEPVVDGAIWHDDRRNPEMWYHEGNVRGSLLRRAREAGADWVLCMDPDERLEQGAAPKIRELISRGEPAIYRFALREMWQPGYYRVDGVWGEKFQDRMFPLAEGQQFRGYTVHNGWAPISPEYPVIPVDINLYHLKMMHPANRASRRALYNRLDPKHEIQPIGYDYLTEEDGIALERIPAGREFFPEASEAPEITVPGLDVTAAAPSQSPNEQPIVGLWDERYKDKPSFPYADTVSYEKASAFLRGRGVVEDWGCGAAWARKFYTPEEYRGIDGSVGFADVVCDLRKYISNVPCIQLRHVLEHNFQWKQVLQNAVRSARERIALILFTPFSEETHQIATHWSGIPDMSFKREDLIREFHGFAYTEESLESSTVYGLEHIFYMTACQPLSEGLEADGSPAKHDELGVDEIGGQAFQAGGELKASRGGRFTGSGWCVDSGAGDLAGGIDIEIGGKLYGALYNRKRLDVAECFQQPAYGYSGFTFDIPMDAFAAGSYPLAVRIVTTDRTGYRRTLLGNLTVSEA